LVINKIDEAQHLGNIQTECSLVETSTFGLHLPGDISNIIRFKCRTFYHASFVYCV